MQLRRWLSGLAGVGALFASAHAAALIMVVDTSAVMPDARVSGDQVLGGIHFDLAAALAVELGQPIQMRALPRKRIAEALAAGSADLVCDYQAAWLPGPFLWSRTFLPDQTVLATDARAPAPMDVNAVGGQVIGTVLGYAYPEVQALLGSRFQREDAPDAVANLRKLDLGRVAHVLTGRRLLAYQLRAGLLTRALHAPLVVAEVSGQCALSARSRLGLTELNAALQHLQASGKLAGLLARYR